MQYRKFGDIDLSAIGFGTATFVKGKFNPNADSVKGIKALETAMDLGVNLIHSSSDLATQWAVRETIGRNPATRRIYHVVKVKLPLEIENLNSAIELAIGKSMQDLEVDQIDIVEHQLPAASQLELSPNTPREYLMRVREAFEKIRERGEAKYLIGMVDCAERLSEVMDYGCYDGYAAYFNLLEFWVKPFLERIERESLGLIIFRALKFGELTDTVITDRNSVAWPPSISQSDFENNSVQSIALNFVLDSQAVKSAVIGMSDCRHVLDNINAIKN